MTSCAYCGNEATHRDHVVPLSRGGPDSPYNIVLACAPCNLSKHARLPSEWKSASELSDLIKEIERRVVDRCSLRDRRSKTDRVKRRDIRLNLTCHCGCPVQCECCLKTQSCYHASFSMAEALNHGSLYWFRECDEGKVVDFRIAVGACGNWFGGGDDDEELGMFRRPLWDVGSLRDAIRKYVWSDDAKAKANETVSELLRVSTELGGQLGAFALGLSVEQ